MNDIQKARDVLAKWREEVTSGTWAFGDVGEFEWRIWSTEADPLDGGSHAATFESPDARLIVGTAGNPDLLDAIDRVLADGANDDVTRWGDHSAYHAASGLAASIIAADERMQQ